MILSWVLGTLMLWTMATLALRSEGVFPSVFSDIASFLCFLIAYACLSGLGFFAGAFSVFWLVLRVCRSINGAPFEVDDSVTVLSGPCTGASGRVCEIIVGQGGQPLVRLDLGGEVSSKCLDIFEDYCLLRQSKRTGCDASAQ